jgi:thymidylate synthase
MIHSDNIKEAWETSIKYLIEEGKFTTKCTDNNSVGSLFGTKNRETIEDIGFFLSLSDPRNRILFSEVKSINYSYMLANFLFLFKKENTLDFIDFYNKKGRMFSDDGKTLNGSIGYRLLNEKNQLKQIAELLLKDTSTRRATIQIFEKGDLYKTTRDYPCINNFQVFNRENKLILLTNMRSQSVYSIMPYDIFVFSMFQEALSKYFNLGLGEYTHFAASFHIYTDEIEKAQLVNGQNSTFLSMNKMLSFNDSVISELFTAEAEIRNLIITRKTALINFEKYKLDEYWKGFLKALFDSYLYPEKGVENLWPVIAVAHENVDKKKIQFKPEVSTL